MAENKTKPEKVDPITFLKSVQPAKRAEEGLLLNEVFSKATGQPPVMWGASIVGYGTYHYVYASGREGDAMRAGFSPRKAKLSIYIMGDHAQYQELFDKLGKYKTGKSCVYVNKLADIDLEVLGLLVKASYDYIGSKQWP